MSTVARQFYKIERHEPIVTPGRIIITVDLPNDVWADQNLRVEGDLDAMDLLRARIEAAVLEARQ